MQDFLEFNNISKSYGNNFILKNVSFKLKSGSILGLMGPNGAGKTTILKIIAGLLQQDSGKILIDGKEISHETKSFVAYVPDILYLGEFNKVRDAVYFFSNFFSDFDILKAKHMIFDLGLQDNQKIKDMSKGNKDKLQLILSVARNAKLYLFDEIITGTDPASREYIINNILNKYNKDSSIIMSTHLIGEFEYIFDDILFMDNGEVYLFENADSLREKRNMSIEQIFKEIFKC